MNNNENQKPGAGENGAPKNSTTAPANNAPKNSTTGAAVTGNKPSTTGAQSQPPKNTEKKETVVVEKGVLEQVLQKQEDQDKEIAGLKKENKKLTAVADKSRLAWYDQKHGEGGLIHTFRVGTYADYEDLDKDGIAKKKIVLGWRMVKDEVRFENGVLKENQTFRLYLDEGEGKKPKEKDINIIEFTREIERKTGELIRESKTSNGMTKTLRFDDGREMEFDVRFLNP